MRKLIVLMMVIIITTISASAYDFMVNGLCYNKNSDGTSVTITYQHSYSPSYSNLSGALTIPASVSFNGSTYLVTSIDGCAFEGCSSLTSVTIPNSVTSIGDNAFSGCSGLTSVNITDIAAWCNIDFDRDDANPLNYAHNLYLNGSKVTNLVIPNSVTSISSWAFCGCSGLRSVTMGDMVTEIGSWAFSDCYGLTSVAFGNAVTSIGKCAFEGCSGLTSLNIGNSVTEIGYGAFEYCSYLTSVTIGNSVTEIGYDAFRGCGGLTSVLWNAKSCSDFSSENSPFGSNIKTFTFGSCVERIPAYLCQYLFGLTSVTIPNSVTTIGECAFYGCSGLTSVAIPNSVTTIGDQAFRGCSGLTSVTIPNSVTTIGGSAFSGCCGLTSVTIPNSVTSIGSSLFFGCSGLTSVDIPNSVNSIDSYAFSGCTGLTSVTIGNSVISIGYGAFEGCSGLTSVTIGNSVTSIGDFAFYGCSGLASVTISTSVESIGKGAFYDTPWDNTLPDGMNYAGLVAYKYKGSMPANTYIIIREGTKGIASNAFYGKNGLAKLFIPSSVTNIGDYAFYNCYSLDSITCEAIEPPTIYDNTFTYYNYNGYLKVPYVSTSSYHAASYWRYFENISFDWSTNLSFHGDTIRICRGIDADFIVPINMCNSHPITALQCNVLLSPSSSISMNDAVLNNSRNGGDHTLSYYNNKILIASPTLKTFKGNDGTLFNINLHTNSTTAGKVGAITLINIIMSTSDGTGIFERGYCWMPVYITYLIGDANGDGSVDAADYVVTCNTIALRPVTTFFQDAANVNQDSHLDVSDLVGITRIALGLDATQMHAPRSKANHLSATPADVKLSSHDIDIANGETATLTIKLNSPIAYKAMQMDMMLPAGLKITSAQLGDRAGALRLMTGETEDGSTRLVASTMGDGVMTAGDGVLLTLTLAADSQWSGDGTISLSNIIAATPNAERHEIEGITINATGTPSGIGIIINDDSNTLVDVYNLNGQLVKTNVKRSEAAKGLPAGYYIIGEEKVYVK